MEAIRALRVEVGRKRAMNIHLTLIPFIKVAGELTTSAGSGEKKANASSQREMATVTGNSLGSVNKYLKTLMEERMITRDYEITEKGKLFLDEHSPKSAIILAAGLGMRMVPINMETPKGLIEIEGEALIAVPHYHP